MGKPLALVVEDDKDIATIAAAALDSAGFETEIIRSGTEAVERLARGETPGLVLLDLTLPGVSGTEILERIRADVRMRGVRVILATGDPVTAEALSDEADLVLLKPFSFDQLHDFAVRMASTLNFSS